MPELHEIVDQIRAFLQSSDQTRSDSLQGLALAYAEACGEINQRLGRCQRLLQLGLRSEAIQLADAEPMLLDATAALGFPERTAWDELVAAYGLAPAPGLLVEAAQFLNEAYAEQEPLQDLLRTHRRLALVRAPLRARIGVLRKLAAQDPNNLIWIDDLRTFEKARFREIQTDATEALRTRDASRVGKLLAELREQTWAEQPSNALLQGLIKADAHLRGQQMQAALADTANRLNDAFAARDPILGRIARQSWTEQTASCRPEANDPIWGHVRPVFDWLDEQDRRDRADRDHEASLAALARTLDEPGHVPPSDLERMAQNVLSYGRGMPERLQRQYVSRIQSAEATQAKRFRMIAAGTAAATLLMGSLVFYLVRSQFRSSNAAEAAAAVNNMLELGELEKARAFVKKLEKTDSGLLTYSPLTDAVERYQFLQEKETDRVLQFAKAVRDSEQAPLSISAPPLLGTAGSLARLETEKQEIARMLERRQVSLQAERAKQEGIVGPRLDAVNLEVGRILQALEAAPVDRPRLLDSLASAGRTLSDVTPNLALASDELQRRAQALRRELDTVRGRLEALERKARLEEEITKAATYPAADRKDNLALFAGRLQDYVSAFPAEPRSLAIKETLNEQTLWYTIDAWNRLVGDWKKDGSGLSPQNASLRAELCGRFLTNHPSFPGAAEVAVYQRYAEATARRVSGEESPAKKLEGLLSDFLVDRVWMVTTSYVDGEGRPAKKQYYTRRKPEEQDEIVQFNSIILFEGKELNRTKPRHVVTYIGLSPRSKVAARFKSLVADESKVDQWERLIIDLFDAILREPEIDPILQVALLRKTIQAGVAGSEPIRESLEGLKVRLERLGSDVNGAWMDPEDRDVDGARSGAAQLIQSLPGLTQSRKQILDRRRQIERSVTRIYRTVGWLTRNRDAWQLQAGAMLPREAELLVVVPTKQSLGEWKKVGTIAESKPKIDGRDESALLEGRPVFIETSF
jgi:hypothetical protein